MIVGKRASQIIADDLTAPETAVDQVAFYRLAFAWLPASGKGFVSPPHRVHESELKGTGNASLHHPRGRRRPV